MQGLERAEEVGARRDADGQAELAAEALGHADRVPVVDRDDRREPVEVDDLGHELVEMPWMRWWPTFLPVVRTGELAGSSGWTRIERSKRAKARATPMTVPPVPTPATKVVGRSPTAPSWARISRPVPKSWASTLASLLNCRGEKLRSCLRTVAAAWIAPTKPPSPSC
ncbi:MAG: hypothetical protein R3F30_11390 [Planctomycetota bacterium]